MRYGNNIERALLEKFPNEIERIWTRTGSAEIATDPMGVELSDIFLTLKPREKWRVAGTQGELVTAMEKELNLPGMRMIFTQPPLATVVIGGVVSSTLLTLLVLPVLYAVFGKSKAADDLE